MARQYFAVRGVRLCVDVTGAIGARPLVLLHALGLDRSSWEPVAPALARTQRVYAVDMRGFGDSDRPGRYSYAEMRDDVLALLDVIGADRADLIGHSMGGTVAWLVAQARPDRLAHLVVEDTPPPRRGSRRARTPPAQPPEDVPFDWQALLALTAELLDPDPSWWDHLPAVTAPVLLLAGGPASSTSQELLTEALRLLPDGRVQEIPVGHHIHQQAPERFVSAVSPFLAS